MLGLELALAGIFEGVPFGLAGLGFALIFRAAQELNFAYGVTIAIGGYITYAAVSGGVPIPLAVVAAVLFCSALGALMRWGAFARLRDHFAVLLFSFGLAVILENVLQLIFGAADVIVESSVMRTRINLVPGTNLSASVVQLIGLAILIVAWLAVWWMLSRTKIGLGMTAVIRDSEVSELVGVKASQLKVLAYAIGSALAGVAGGLTVMDTGVRPSLGFSLLLYGFIATLLAGSRFVHAAIWGVALGVVLNLSAIWLEAQYRTLIVFVLLVVYLAVRMLRMPRIAI